MQPSNQFIPTEKVKRSKINRRFKPEEDELLRDLVSKYGENDWRKISHVMKNRSVRQCKDRWFQYLSPSANRTPWTMKEETDLLALVKKYGKDWKIISYSFPGRPIAQLRNKYKTVEGRYLIHDKKPQLIKQATIEKKPEEEVEEIGKETWNIGNFFDLFQEQPLFDSFEQNLDCWF